MKNKGYTITDILIVIVLLGVSALIIIPSVSNAFKTNNNEAHDKQMNMYLEQAKKYGLEHLDKLKEHDNILVLSLDELIDEGYIVALVDKNLYDAKDNTTIINDMKIKITYDSDRDLVFTEYL